MIFIYIPLYLIFYLIKRIFFTFLYPVSYLCRKQITKKVRSKYDYSLWDKQHILKFDSKPPLFWKFLWFSLDDAPYFLNGKVEYFGGHYLPYIIRKLNIEFLKSFWWGAIRNNAVNLSRVMAIKGFIKSEQLFKIGKKGFARINHYKGFPYKAPYLEFWIGSIRFETGFFTRGIFEINVRGIKNGR